MSQDAHSISEHTPRTEDEIAKAAAAALSAEFGQHLETYVEKAAAGEVEKPDASATRELSSILGTTAAVVQIGWAIIEVAKFCWRQYQTLRDKAAVAKAARAEVNLPGFSGEQRDKIIDAVVEKLSH